MTTSFRDAFPILEVDDVQRSLAFYTGPLGFTEEYRFPDEGDPVFVSLQVPGGKLAIGAASTRPVQSASTAIWLYCDDVDAAVEALRAGGATVLQEPVDQPWGERQASVADPDGYTVHIAVPPSA